ncbi:MAG: DUF3786 domain-containing protein [Candidatus Omnitrophica bacterium]|nr:DUF3786 domain-containing protein [Candidatus Omnitrophota bacterium]
MTYTAALEKAWKDLANIAKERRYSVKFVSDTYDIDLDGKTVISASCSAPTREYTVIIILHYLTQKLLFGKLPEPAGEWIDFNQIEGGDAYYPTFRKRTIERIIKKYGKKPEDLLAAAGRLPHKKGPVGDVSVVIYPFEEVGILIKMSKADEEFGPDANILYDANIPRIFCTEDIVVLTELVVNQL